MFFILFFTNAGEADKSELIAEPGMIMPLSCLTIIKYTTSVFVPNFSGFKSKVLLGHVKPDKRDHKP